MNNTSPIAWQNYLSSGNRLFIGSNAAVPDALINDLIEHSTGLNDIEVVHILTLTECLWAQKKYRHLFKVNTLFIGTGVRQAIAEGYGDYTPCFLSEVPSLFSDNILPLDVALIMVSPPDEYGYCSLGVSVDVVSAAAKSAKYVIAQINPNMPRTNGQSFIHMDDIDASIEIAQDLPEITPSKLDRVTEQIGQYVSMLIDNGDTLQLGIGKIPDAVLRYLCNHKDLGIHTEMLSDGAIDLIKKGVINNRKKTLHPGKTVTSFCMGSQALYDFVDNNPHIEFHPSEYVNSPVNIARNDNMVSINSAIEVDLTGQVVSDSVGYRFYSGIGGQVDFIRGAAMSKNGMPIIALPSTAKNGRVSKIVPVITEGSGVVTSRGDVHYVVTEYGIASLRGKSIRERALELIKVAHPKFRDQLLAEVRKHYWVPEYIQQKPIPVPELGDIGMLRLQANNHDYLLRPLTPSDERLLQEFFYSHNKDTLLMRYNHQPSQMTRETSASLVSVDQSRDLALCITSQQGHKEKLQAVGRYYYCAQDNSAEVAFVVRESQRRKGLAKALLQQMMKVARARQLSKFTAFTRADNKPMLTVFKNFGFTALRGDSLDEVCLELIL